MKIDTIDFNSFRISNKWTQIAELDPNFTFSSAFRSLAPTSTATAATATSITSELANALKKGIKRDSTLFSVLKEDNQYDS